MGDIHTFDGYVLYGTDNAFKYVPIGVVASDGRNKSKCSLNSIPKSLIEKLVKIEDARFYSHFGIDLKGILRALIRNLKARKIVQGGSTLTQQLARNLFEDNSRSLIRKIREIFFALYLDFKYSKQTILELYFNTIFWGKNVYGLRSACLFYFGKEVNKLNDSEEITLLTLLRGPNYYLQNENAFRKRLKLLNYKLFQSGLQSKNKFIKSKKKSANILKYKLGGFKNECIPHLITSVDERTYTIYTTLNKSLQNCLSEFLLNQKMPLSIIVIKDKKVIGVSSTHGSNHAFLYKSNVGSTLKPFVYTILRKHGIERDELISTIPLNTYEWHIRETKKLNSNYSTLGDALFLSTNNAFVNASIKIGLSKVLTELKKILPSQGVLTPSIILGASQKGISLFELTLLYNTFFLQDSDEIKMECKKVLNESLKARLKLNINDGYLKTGTTNDFQQRFAVFGSGNLTIGFLTEGFRSIEQEDYEKDEDYLFIVKKFIGRILKTL